MKKGDLVKWSQIWLDGCKTAGGDIVESLRFYRSQVGVILTPVDQPLDCYRVLWNDGQQSDVHYEFLEVL